MAMTLVDRPIGIAAIVMEQDVLSLGPNGGRQVC